MVAVQAGAQTSVGRETHAITPPTVGVGHRCDHPDGAAPALDLVVGGGTVAAAGARVGDQWTEGPDLVQNFLAGYHMVPSQVRHLTHRHQLDEAHVEGMHEGEPGEILDLVVVDATHHHHIELHRAEPRVVRSAGGVHGIEGDPPPCDRRDAIRAQRVRAHIHTVQTGRLQRRGELRKLHAIGAERDILDTRNGSEHRDQRDEFGADRRFATGDAKPLEAEGGQLPHHRGDLLVGQDVRARQPIEPLLRHTIHTPEVATVGDADAEILDAAAVLIDHEAAPTHSRVPSV